MPGTAFGYVSIPYGSIKRWSPFVGASKKLKFQFLMVQLKVLIKEKRNSLSLVSIPYGSIKRLSKE